MPTRSGAGWRWRAALIGSLIVHVGLGAWAITHFAEPRGGRGVQLEAIEVEIVTAAALESLQAAARATGGSAGVLAEQTGYVAERETAEPQTAAAAAMPRDVVVLSTRDSDAPINVPEPAKTADDTPQQADAQAPPAPTPRDVVAAEAGGSVALAVDTALAPTAAAAGAAPGEIARFRNDVRKALSRHPPRQGPGGPPVTAIVAFRVSELGRVENAELLLPSRNARTDKLLLAWITGAPMPVPPAGMKPDDRFYCIPVGSSVTQLQLQERCR